MTNRKAAVMGSDGRMQGIQSGDTITDASGNPILASSTPTGTGFRHCTSGTEDAATKLIDSADINDGQVGLGKLANLAADKYIVRVTPSTGVPETATITAAGRALVAAATAAAQILTFGISASIAELNFSAGVTSAVQTQLDGKQALHANLTAWSGLTGAADKLGYFTGVGAAVTTDFTSFARTLVAGADAPAARSTLGLVIGTNVQAYSANLAAIAGLTSGSNKLLRFTGSGTADLLDFSTDGTFAGNSDTTIASQKATKTYVDALLGANDAMAYKGALDCSANPNYPAADAGHTYKVSVAGKIGGASGVNVEIGDMLICTADSTVSGNQATVGSFWNIWQGNLDGAVIGPASATDGHFVQFDGTTGKLIKGGLSLDTDGTLSANSDTRVASQKAAKTYVVAYAQPVDATLTALAAYNTNGLLAQTADDTFVGRTLTGTANEITVSNGDGVSGNPTLSLPATIDLSGKTYLKIPTSAAPTVDANGKIAVDTTVTDWSHGIIRYYSGEEIGIVAMPIAAFTSPTDGYVIAYNATNDEFELVAQSGGGAGLSDTDYGDITVSGSGTVMTIDNDVVTYAKMQNVSATDKLLGRSTAGAGDVEEIACTPVARTLIAQTTQALMRTTGLGCGTIATQNANAVAITGGDVNGLTTFTAVYGWFNLPGAGTLPTKVTDIISATPVIVAYTEGSPHEFAVVHSGNTATGTRISAMKTRAASAMTPTVVVQDGDEILGLRGYGSDATNYVNAAIIQFSVDGTPGSGDVPGKIVFGTAASGAGSATAKMTLKANGRLLIGTTSDDGANKLQVTGGVSLTGQLTSTLADGTAPLVVTSTTVVANLNVSKLLGKTWAVPDTIGSTTPNTGAFTTLTANGATTLTAGTASTTTTTGTLVVTGGVGVSGAVNIGGALGAAGAVTFTVGTASTSTTTGTAVITGGVGISGATWIGGLINVAGAATITGATTLTGALTANGVATFNKAAITAVITLTDAATIATDASLGNYFEVTLAASRTMGVPTNAVGGQIITYGIRQSGAGAFTITWTTGSSGAFLFTTSRPAPTLGPALSKVDYVSFRYDSTNSRWVCLGYAIQD